jgi:hypothetical protein
MIIKIKSKHITKEKQIKRPAKYAGLLFFSLIQKLLSN